MTCAEKTPVPPTTATRNEIEVTAQTLSEQGTVDSVADSVSLKVVPFRGERSPAQVRVSVKEESEFEIAVRTLVQIRSAADLFRSL